MGMLAMRSMKSLLVDAGRELRACESSLRAQGQEMRFDKGSRLFYLIGVEAFRFDSGQLFCLIGTLSVGVKTFRFERKRFGPKQGRTHSECRTEFGSIFRKGQNLSV